MRSEKFDDDDDDNNSHNTLYLRNMFSFQVYTIIQEEGSISGEVIVSLIIRKEIPLNLCVITEIQLFEYGALSA